MKTIRLTAVLLPITFWTLSVLLKSNFIILASKTARVEPGKEQVSRPIRCINYLDATTSECVLNSAKKNEFQEPE